MAVPLPPAGPPAPDSLAPPQLSRPVATLQELLTSNLNLNQAILTQTADLRVLEGRMRQVTVDSVQTNQAIREIDQQFSKMFGQLIDRERVKYVPGEEEQAPVSQEVEAAWKRREEFQKQLADLMQEKKILNQSIPSLKARIEKNKKDVDKLIERVTIRCLEEQELPPEGHELYAKILHKLMNHLALDYENKSLMMRKILDHLIEEGPIDPKTSTKSEADKKDADKVAELNKQREKIAERYSKLFGNLNEQLVQAAKASEDKNLSLQVIGALDDLMARAPYLAVNSLARISMDERDRVLRFLLDNLEPAALLRVIKLIALNDIQHEAVKLLSGSTTVVSLIRGGSLTEHLAVEFQKHSLDPANREPLLSDAFKAIKKLCAQNLEIDPAFDSRLDVVEQQRKFKKVLTQALKIIRDELKDVRKHLPAELREFYKYFFDQTRQYLFGNENTQLMSFFILRYFAPKLISQLPGSEMEKRNLLQLAKALQSMATQKEPNVVMKFLFLPEKEGELPFNEQILPLLKEIIRSLAGDEIK